jgi:hypothetical protein
MTVTLMCSKSPWTLGIVENHRMINLDKLHDHVGGCEICRQYYNENIFSIMNRIITQEKQQDDLQEKMFPIKNQSVKYYPIHKQKALTLGHWIS